MGKHVRGKKAKLFVGIKKRLEIYDEGLEVGASAPIMEVERIQKTPEILEGEKEIALDGEKKKESTPEMDGSAKAAIPSGVEIVKKSEKVSEVLESLTSKILTDTIGTSKSTFVEPPSAEVERKKLSVPQVDNSESVSVPEVTFTSSAVLRRRG